jgi:hypothetical protein
MTGVAVSVLIAKPVASAPVATILALVMPTTSPFKFTSGPPLLPGFIAALVSIKL